MRYPFGFGLTYTQFETDYTAEEENGKITVTAKVKNIGNFTSREVVQVYFGAPCGSLGTPEKQLIAYKKTKELKPQEIQSLEIVFVGNTLSSTYTKELLDYVKDKEFSINVISKSGTTTEPAVAFRLFKELLEQKYGEESYKRIYATTDKVKGALRTMAETEKYETFVVPDDIGGRYSWFTAVGLLPIACAGIDIDKLMEGSKDAYLDATTNVSYFSVSAIVRNAPLTLSVVA